MKITQGSLLAQGSGCLLFKVQDRMLLVKFQISLCKSSLCRHLGKHLLWPNKGTRWKGTLVRVLCLQNWHTSKNIPSQKAGRSHFLPVTFQTRIYNKTVACVLLLMEDTRPIPPEVDGKVSTDVKQALDSAHDIQVGLWIMLHVKKIQWYYLSLQQISEKTASWSAFSLRVETGNGWKWCKKKQLKCYKAVIS